MALPLCPVLSVLWILANLILIKLSEISSTTTSILHIRKLGHREVR